MLEEISVAKVASYGDAPEVLSNLRSINFVFGTNGSGKTTLSRLIADGTEFPECRLLWKANRPLECLVYNADFARSSYVPQMPGIFTLGEGATEALERIREQKTRVSALDEEIAGLRRTLGEEDHSSGKRADLHQLRQRFEENCWRIKSDHDQHFKDAFSGVRNSKEKFCTRALDEHQTNTANLVGVDELKRKAATIFEQGIARHSTLPGIDFVTIADNEAPPILTKRVVGKEDVDVAGLIRRLGNSDWVRQGLSYIPNAPAPCPFCQQEVSEALRRDLNDYFDETFLTDVAEIKRVAALYMSAAELAVTELRQLVNSPAPLLDQGALKPLIDRLESLLNANILLIAQKEKEPSAPIVLGETAEIVDQISALLVATNNRINEHNALVQNLATEQVLLKQQIWKCIIAESQESFDEYALEHRNINAAIKGLTGRINAKRAEMAAATARLSEMEREITSVQPTVDAICGILNSFGFTGFRLKTAGELNNLYEIVRSDGADATPTLSEGERSFVTFLYFYHLLRGSMSESGMTADRIVVFDDPVSSLDSDILFIVSALIKKVLDEAVSGRGYIKQAFVLTHNIYFHKEVSFDPKRNPSETRAHETFWIVRKAADVSKLTSYSYNPIKTSYELLWSEVRNAHRSNLTIQNTLRRILENYFKLLGNLDRDQIVPMFEGRDQQICASLFSWVNDGSHAAHDDLYVSQDDQIVGRYLDVFRQIFERTGHGSHYRMMTGTSEPVVTAAAIAEVMPEETTVA